MSTDSSYSLIADFRVSPRSMASAEPFREHKKKAAAVTGRRSRDAVSGT